MLTVCCIKTGEKYSAEYVNRLVRGVSSWTRDFIYRFVCITNDPIGIDTHPEKWETVAAGDRSHYASVECLPLSDPQLPGWWGKMSLFRPEGAFGQIKGRVLFLDLDVIITGPLDDLINFPSDFVMMHDLQRPWRPASAVMLIEAGSRAWIWDVFQKNATGLMRSLHGDQDAIREIMEPNSMWGQKHYGQRADFFPQRWIRSYKQDAVNGPPKDCRIVAFHGSPKNHEITSGWVKNTWV